MVESNIDVGVIKIDGWVNEFNVPVLNWEETYQEHSMYDVEYIVYKTKELPLVSWNNITSYENRSSFKDSNDIVEVGEGYVYYQVVGKYSTEYSRLRMIYSNIVKLADFPNLGKSHLNIRKFGKGDMAFPKLSWTEVEDVEEYEVFADVQQDREKSYTRKVASTKETSFIDFKYSFGSRTTYYIKAKNEGVFDESVSNEEMYINLDF